MLMSLFCGAGGLDLGFENAGYDVRVAFDLRADGIASYNHNRPGLPRGIQQDVSELTLEYLDRLEGVEFAPEGVIGGPPCQSFSRANTVYVDADPRHSLPITYARLLKKLNERNPVKFFVMENVTGLASDRHIHRLEEIERELALAGFSVARTIMRATDYQTPQIRERLFIVGLNKKLYGDAKWKKPAKTTLEGMDVSVRGAIGHLPAPAFYSRNLKGSEIPVHVNHWCMQPKSPKFTTVGALIPGNGRNRSFKTLSWERPSPTVAYGNREVHVHPTCTRRLSVYEAMMLQGFPADYELLGSLSSQILQVSEAVPPPLALAVACSVRDLIARLDAERKMERAA